MSRRSTSAVLAFALAAAFACTPPDPVHDRAVEKLGGETGAADAFHRAGQPCGTCHNVKSNGPAQTDFSVAGTVFATRSSLAGAEGVTIQMTDSAGTSPPVVTTNCAGNFFVPRGTWDPVLPIVTVKMTKGTTVRSMLSPIGGTASCADCHRAKAVPDDPLSQLGAVYMFDDGTPVPPAMGCP